MRAYSRLGLSLGETHDVSCIYVSSPHKEAKYDINLERFLVDIIEIMGE